MRHAYPMSDDADSVAYVDGEPGRVPLSPRPFLSGNNPVDVPTVEDFHRALEEAGVENEIVTYPGAPHAFFDWGFAEHREACDDAWRRMLAFVGRPPG